MTTITKGTPGSRFGNGVSAGGQVTINNNVYPLGEHARWQWNLTGAESSGNAGSNLQLQAIADDGTTVVATSMSVARSTGVVTLIAGSSALTYFADGTVSAPSVASTSNHGSGLYFTTNAVNVAANGVRVADFATAATGVNYFVFTPSATGAAIALSAAGSDTNIGLTIAGKGTGPLTIGAATSNITLGSGAALATSATTGYIIISTCAGAPTGVPVGHATGNAALVYDTTDSKLYAYDSGTWKSAAFT